MAVTMEGIGVKAIQGAPQRVVELCAAQGIEFDACFGDAPALALRGIVMAQLGDLVRAKALLRSAARAFGPKETLARARCVVAEAEIALVSRELSWPAKALDSARATLEARREVEVDARVLRAIDEALGEIDKGPPLPRGFMKRH